jgi:hypothetical protein
MESAKKLKRTSLENEVIIAVVVLYLRASRSTPSSSMKRCATCRTRSPAF